MIYNEINGDEIQDDNAITNEFNKVSSNMGSTVARSISNPSLLF